MPITPSPAVLRACDVLEHLAANPSETYTVSELARALAMPRATCDGVLLALADRAFVARNGDDLRYSLGAGCVAVGDAARAAGSLVLRVAPLVEELARETGTCAALAGHDGVELRVEQVFDHGPAFGVRTRPGESVPLGAPFGAVFVAWEPDAVVDRWLDRGGRPLGPDERHRTRAALAAIRRWGYAVALAPGRAGPVEANERDAVLREVRHGDYLPVDLDAAAALRVTQVTAPVFDRTGRVVLGVMVLGPTFDLTAAEVAALGDRMRAVAAEASRRIGGVEPPVGPGSGRADPP